jgi:hypothetical protein
MITAHLGVVCFLHSTYTAIKIQPPGGTVKDPVMGRFYVSCQYPGSGRFAPTLRIGSNLPFLMD